MLSKYASDRGRFFSGQHMLSVVFCIVITLSNILLGGSSEHDIVCITASERNVTCRDGKSPWKVNNKVGLKRVVCTDPHKVQQADCEAQHLANIAWSCSVLRYQNAESQLPQPH